jgi:hypothetical protein
MFFFIAHSPDHLNCGGFHTPPDKTTLIIEFLRADNSVFGHINSISKITLILSDVENTRIDLQTLLPVLNSICNFPNQAYTYPYSLSFVSLFPYVYVSPFPYLPCRLIA